MVVYEIKNPSPPPEKPAPKSTQTPEVETAPPVARVQFFKREWQRKHWPKQEQSEERPISKQEKSIRALARQVNEDLAKAGVLMHIVLIREEHDYLLEIYDCTEKNICKIIEDVTIPFDDLPHLIKNLQEQAGILVDTIS